MNTDAADLLDNAAAMLNFLIDVAPAMAKDQRADGLTGNGAFGLTLIFDHINATIKQARDIANY